MGSGEEQLKKRGFDNQAKPGKRSPRRTGDSPQSHEAHEGKSPILLGDLCAVLKSLLLPSGRKRPVQKSHKEIGAIAQSLRFNKAG